MSPLLSYSGLTTKIRAMEGHLITDEEYRRIAELATVGEVVSFLRAKPGYREVFAEVDETNLRRGQVERHLTESIYWGFMRIYHFAGPEQKPFLDLYFKRYEIFIIKRYLHRIENHRDYNPHLGCFDEFFRRHTQLKLERMSAAATVEDLIHSLAGTEYYAPLAKLLERSDVRAFDYEMTLDMYYFSRIWKMKDKILKGQDLESLTRAYGVKFDLLNLDWIRRSREYYRLSPPEIYNMMIPLHHKLSRQEINGLVECATKEEFSNILRRTWYGGQFEQLTPETIEEMYTEILKATLKKESRQHPYSAAMIYSYLYQKEHEIDRLTTALECIRYHLDAQTTYQYIMKN